ncbi:uncharacterized protein LOC133305160 [Gastrolobium bilobum]|uniref:uncharacterized protein LOC133305160 n=1 Tax=Gastrolobium bilobum TaxID=150636 RepID=UPI002AB2ADB9|nr:uncharacterized protein LOC133305160 [Gastrolobium bilobum]
MAAEKWLQAMEKIFRVMRCPDAMKLVYSVYMLEEEAEDWEAREQKQNEYNDLKQGSMSIDQYFTKFNELVKYANYGRALPTPAEMTSKKVEEVYKGSQSKKSPEAQATNANKATGSSYWKNKKMKGKKLNVNNPFDLFKKSRTQKNFVDRGPPPKCKGCGKEHRGPCATGELRRYVADPSHVVQPDDVEIREKLKTPVGTLKILERDEKRLRNKSIPIVKVQVEALGPTLSDQPLEQAMELD